MNYQLEKVRSQNANSEVRKGAVGFLTSEFWFLTSDFFQLGLDRAVYSRHGMPPGERFWFLLYQSLLDPTPLICHSATSGRRPVRVQDY
jgi:hypothetical protein